MRRTAALVVSLAFLVAAVRADTALDGDLDVDGDVDAADLAQLGACLPSNPCYVDSGGGCCAADLDADTDVDCADREGLLAAWTDPGGPPPGSCSLVPALPSWTPFLTAVLLIFVFRTLQASGLAPVELAGPYETDR